MPDSTKSMLIELEKGKSALGIVKKTKQDTDNIQDSALSELKSVTPESMEDLMKSFIRKDNFDHIPT